jgi:lysophospholipase L1-like esterase
VRASAAAARLGATVAVAVLAGACSGGSADDRRTAAPTGEPEVYVAVGSSETLGAGADNPFTESWPRVLYRTALDRDAVFVNAAADGSTVADALDEQLRLALEMEPALVTVWLALDDLASGVPAATYERQLAELIGALRRGGRTEVLVATVPPVDHIPSYVGGDDIPLPIGEDGEVLVEDRVAPELSAAQVAAYDEAITRVARAAGATVVDVGMAADAGAGVQTPLVTDNGISTEAQARIAELFAAARRSG